MSCNKPLNLPRSSAVAISAQYIGMTPLRMPTATPAIARPTASIAKLTAPPWRAQPNVAMTAPRKTLFQSQRKCYINA